MMTAKEIRDSFKSFFESKEHLIVPSAPMVVKDDPTLMFTNAGMNQFKDIILGNRAPKSRRVADSQKCLRVSGKHNDLEEVGHDLDSNPGRLEIACVIGNAVCKSNTVAGNFCVKTHTCLSIVVSA